jgi:DNA-binding sugar fermentation-stimulating protein
LRDDVIYFRPNYEKDIIFSNLLEDAVKKGVIVKAFKLKYSKNNIKFVKEIPVIFKKNN